MPPRGNDGPAPRVRPRLYAVIDGDRDPAAAAEAFGPASAAADIAAVLLRFAPDADDGTVVRRAKALAGPVQRRGAALLLENHAALASEAGADGAHCTGAEAVQAALAKLKPDRIVGAGGLSSRHAAMVAAEAGADYVMFGEPGADGARPAFSAILERVAWWTEIFETPCVGFAADLDELAALARAGAEFVAVGGMLWNDSRGPAAALVEAARRLHATELA